MRQRENGRQRVATQRGKKSTRGEEKGRRVSCKERDPRFTGKKKKNLARTNERKGKGGQSQEEGGGLVAGEKIPLRKNRVEESAKKGSTNGGLPPELRGVILQWKCKVKHPSRRKKKTWALGHRTQKSRNFMKRETDTRESAIIREEKNTRHDHIAGGGRKKGKPLGKSKEEEKPAWGRRIKEKKALRHNKGKKKPHDVPLLP